MTKLSDNLNLVLFKGRPLKVSIRYSPVIPCRTMLKNEYLEVTLQQSASIKGNLKSQIAMQIENWLKAQARRSFCEEVERQSHIFGFKYNDVSIKDTRSRWGSCSAKGNLNFNWRLVMAPEEILNYVVVHETAHLSHLDHSEDFWNLVGKRFPAYQKAKNWLRMNGASLMNWKFQPSS